MGHIHADFVVLNHWTKRQVSIRALVDTGTTEFCVTPEVARELGFDLDEVSQRYITVADGRRILVPRIAVEIGYGDRGFHTEALVLGTECLVGSFPLEILDLIIDPRNQQLVGRCPEGPVSRAVSVRLC